MSGGSLDEAPRRQNVLAVALVVIIAGSALLIGLAHLDRGWSIALQIVSAIAGAALGNALRADFSRDVVRNQAKPATRHLWSQVARLQAVVTKTEGYAFQLRQSTKEPADFDRVADWFDALGENIRSEIEATADAIDAWGDLAPDVQAAELKTYRQRQERLPTAEKKGDGSD